MYLSLLFVFIQFIYPCNVNFAPKVSTSFCFIPTKRIAYITHWRKITIKCLDKEMMYAFLFCKFNKKFVANVVSF